MPEKFFPLAFAPERLATPPATRRPEDDMRATGACNAGAPAFSCKDTLAALDDTSEIYHTVSVCARYYPRPIIEREKLQQNFNLVQNFSNRDDAEDDRRGCPPL